MKKYLIWILLCLAVIFAGCSETTKPIPETMEAETIPAVTESLTVRDVLEGEWIAAGIISKGNVISFSQNDALADLYDSNWVYIYDDATYQLQNGIYTYDGVWLPLELEGQEHFYMLRETGYYSMAVGGGEQKESDKTYYAAFLDQDWNVLLIYENLEEEESPLIYVRDGKQKYLDALMSGGQTQSETKPSNQPNKTTVPESCEVTSGMRNALKAAKNYLDFMPFSYSGLIEQLKYEGYTTSEATYAVDHCGADWYAQAVRSAENYLELMAFSRSGLIEQLEYEGYTHDQAVYAVEQVY